MPSARVVILQEGVSPAGVCYSAEAIENAAEWINKGLAVKALPGIEEEIGRVVPGSAIVEEFQVAGKTLKRLTGIIEADTFPTLKHEGGEASFMF